MRFPVFASFIAAMLLYSIFTKRAQKNNGFSEKDFWALENKANSTRRKSLDHLDYIVIPLHTLPMDVLENDSLIAEYHAAILQLSKEKIVNFTGISNTDLKIKYGTANISTLSGYDQYFTHLVRVLQDWAKRLYELDCHQEALSVLEFAISIRSDISASYYLAASLYKEFHTPEKIQNLIDAASSLNSVMKNSIVRTLQESDPDNGLPRF